MRKPLFFIVTACVLWQRLPAFSFSFGKKICNEKLIERSRLFFGSFSGISGSRQNQKLDPTVIANRTTRLDGNRKSIAEIDGTLLSFIVICILLMVPNFSVLAVDHPSDYFHLNIPNPIPDADPRYFISGGLCAAVSHGVTTPIDVVKTRIQSEPGKYKLSVLDTTKMIVEEEGLGDLLKGLGPTILGYGLEGSAKFGLYESLKPEMSRLLNLDNPAIPYLIASVIAGAAASIILCPLERTRIRLVTDPTFASNLFIGIPLLIEETGVLGLFSGFPAMLSKQVPYTIGKQVSFDEIAKQLYKFVTNPNLGSTKLEVSFAAAFLASIVACILSQPGDVILTETYKRKTFPSDSFSQICSSIYRRQGIQSFYSGITARLFHVSAIITSQLLLYDYIKQLLGLPATGST